MEVDQIGRGHCIFCSRTCSRFKIHLAFELG